jgi:hypothetical protein
MAEGFEVVSLWRGREREHGDQSEAYKRLFDIYTQNVVVCSRDETMREAERR